VTGAGLDLLRAAIAECARAARAGTPFSDFESAVVSSA
jgi:hypothetical protein